MIKPHISPFFVEESDQRGCGVKSAMKSYANYHRINGLQCFGQAIDNQGELVLADMNQAFLVLFHILNGLRGVQSSANRQLQWKVLSLTTNNT